MQIAKMTHPNHHPLKAQEIKNPDPAGRVQRQHHSYKANRETKQNHESRRKKQQT
jgi:hypothetical protein